MGNIWMNYFIEFDLLVGIVQIVNMFLAKIFF